MSASTPIDPAPLRSRFWKNSEREHLVPLRDAATEYGITVNEAAYLVALGKLPNTWRKEGQPYMSVFSMRSHDVLIEIESGRAA